MKKHVFASFASLVFGVASLPCAAASVTSFVTKERKVVVVLSGEIVAGDADRIATIIRAANAANRFVSGARLNSPGGDLAEGVKLADIIRNAKMATVVPSGASCASACFVAFAAGADKYVSNNATVGVHGASEAGAETPSSSAATIAMARIVKDLGAPTAVLGKMVVTPPSEIVWLTANDLRAMGTTMTGRPSQLSSVTQTTPTQQLSSTSAESIKAEAPTWKTFTDKAIAMSASQHGGQPAFFRNCQPELKICNNGLFLKGDKGVDLMVRVTENISGAQLQREVCSFNSFGDVRKCVDWDSGTSRTDMKDPTGKWVQVDQKATGASAQ